MPSSSSSSTNDDAAATDTRLWTLPSLLALGIGGTVGSGLFVLTGRLIVSFSGADAHVSWAVAGVAALCSGTAFCEWSCRHSVDGSTYAYVSLCTSGGVASGAGGVGPVVAAACLTLEYAVAGAAVARTWGDKINVLLSWKTGDIFNGPAGVMAALCTLLLASGVKESQSITLWLTVLKMLLVAFLLAVAIYGAWIVPPASTSLVVPFGAAGVVRGATSSFFGYLGYDEICCLAGQAARPSETIPVAVLGTIVTVTFIYVLSAYALVRMVPDPVHELDATAAFASAFSIRGWDRAASWAAWGEVVTLPVVVFISLLAQPRLLARMAHDGYFILSEQAAIQLSGLGMTILALFVPFAYLDDGISAGILLAFSMTNSTLVRMRLDGRYITSCLALYNALCFVTACTWKAGIGWSGLSITLTCASLACVVFLWFHGRTTGRFGEGFLNESQLAACNRPDISYFRTPLMPFVPCVGVAVNWYLVAQLETCGLVILAFYLASCVGVYKLWGQTSQRDEYQAVTTGGEQNDEDEMELNVLTDHSNSED